MDRFTEESPGQLVQAMHARAEAEVFDEDLWEIEPPCACRRTGPDQWDREECAYHNPASAWNRRRRARERQARVFIHTEGTAALMVVGLAAVEAALERRAS